MKDLITLLIYGVLFIAVITLFIQLLPVLIIAIIVMMVVRYFKEKKQIDSTSNEYETNYEEYNSYQTSGNIKQDVIDVEYTETIEK